MTPANDQSVKSRSRFALFWRRALGACFLGGCLLAGLLLWASGGIQRPRRELVAPETFFPEPAVAAPVDGRLTVLTWNIAWACGKGSDANDYAPRSKVEMAERLRRVGELIRSARPDVVLLQEVDFNSHRSYHVDQLKQLALLTGLPYAARAVSWKANWLPWPLRHPFGSMCSGGGVLSRFPILSHQVQLYPKPKSNSALWNAFYLFRYNQAAQIRWGDQTLWVINNQLDAYDQTNRAEQASAVSELVRGLAESNRWIVVAGDMNTVPLGASQAHAFADSPRIDYRGDTTMRVLQAMPGLKDVLSEEAYKRDELRYCTFPAYGPPNRRLDYVFASTNCGVQELRLIALADKVDPVSDHLPQCVVLRLQADPGR